MRQSPCDDNFIMKGHYFLLELETWHFMNVWDSWEYLNVHKMKLCNIFIYCTQNQILSVIWVGTLSDVLWKPYYWKSVFSPVFSATPWFHEVFPRMLSTDYYYNERLSIPVQNSERKYRNWM
jgi:hypothetical protein